MERRPVPTKNTTKVRTAKAWQGDVAVAGMSMRRCGPGLSRRSACAAPGILLPSAGPELRCTNSCTLTAWAPGAYPRSQLRAVALPSLALEQSSRVEEGRCCTRSKSTSSAHRPPTSEAAAWCSVGQPRLAAGTRDGGRQPACDLRGLRGLGQLLRLLFEVFLPLEG